MVLVCCLLFLLRQFDLIFAFSTICTFVFFSLLPSAHPLCTGRFSPCRLSAHRHAVTFRKHRKAGAGRAHRTRRYDYTCRARTRGAVTLRRRRAKGAQRTAGWSLPLLHDDALLLTLSLLCYCALCAHVVLLRCSLEWRCVLLRGDCVWLRPVTPLAGLRSAAPRHPSPRHPRCRCSQALVCSPTSPPLRLPRRPPRLLPPLPSRSAPAPRWSAAPRSGTRR